MVQNEPEGSWKDCSCCGSAVTLDPSSSQMTAGASVGMIEMLMLTNSSYFASQSQDWPQGLPES
jgi:hypothetical protein